MTDMLVEQPATPAEQATNIGRVVAVNGDHIRVRLEPEFIEEASAERVGQLGTYALVDLGAVRLVGVITSIELYGDTKSHGSMRVQMFGQIKQERFRRGMDCYPAAWDRVVLPTEEDLAAILGASQAAAAETTDSFLLLGRSAIRREYPVFLRSQQFFSRHAAVLGNSGAGKSCTVARILSEAIKAPQSQIVLFDLHGEYREAFTDDSGQLLPNVNYLNEQDLVIPYWLLQYRELESLFVDRSDRTLIANQASFLKEALTKLKRPVAKARELLLNYTIDTPIYYSFENLRTYASNMNAARYVLGTKRFAFANNAQRNLKLPEQEEILLTQQAHFNQGNAEGEIPHAMYCQKLIGLIDQIDHKLNDRRYDFLFRPVEHARASEVFTRHFPQVKEDQDDHTHMIEWMIQLILGQLTPRRNLTIIDLSAIPYDIIDLTVGLLTRVLFDYNFFTERVARQPVLLVFEEAHNYIRNDDLDQGFARPAVEKVAKEGRKYGVSMFVVSQRPSELSNTVLSQCNNMVVLRMNNPQDQKYVSKAVSDHFADMITMLPMLRPGEAFIIGDCVPLPMRTQISLPDHTPASANVDFIKSWSADMPARKISDTIERWFHQRRPNN